MPENGRWDFIRRLKGYSECEFAALVTASKGHALFHIVSCGLSSSTI
jgi:hypothetical protein